MKITNLPGATPIDLQGLIPNLTTQEELNEFEAKNIIDAMIWLSKSRIFKKELLSATGLYKLHRKMFDQTWKWAGKPRTTQTVPGIATENIQNQIGALLGDVKFWIANDTYQIDEIAIRFHHKLVWIHPFLNGNGRWSRLASDLLLEFNDESRFTWGPDELTKKGPSREKYLKALKIADREENYGALLKFAKS